MFSNLPPVTKALLIANGIAFVLQLILPPGTFDLFALWPLGGDGGDPYASMQTFLPWQLVSYGFLHADFGHLFFNMLALLMFGAPLEYTWRDRRFVTFYFVCLIGAGVCQLIVASWMLSRGMGVHVTIGASGGVYGLILAYGLTFPRQRVAIFPLPLLLPARNVAIMYGVVALAYGIFGSRDGVAHFAHVGGMLAGWMLLRYWAGKPPFGRPKPPRLRSVK